MTVRWKKETLALLLGDLFFFVAALWLALLVRYASFPAMDDFAEHLYYFSLIFIFSLAAFFIIGLYDKQTNAIKKKLPNMIIGAQVACGMAAVFVFYFTPYLALSPKITLVLYVAISTLFVYWWRMRLVEYVYIGRREPVLLVGNDEDALALEDELSKNAKYKMDVERIDRLESESQIGKGIITVVADLDKLFSGKDENRSGFSHLIFSNIRFIDAHDLYEDIFDKVALDCVDDRWFLKYASHGRRLTYDVLKRIMDVTIALSFGILALIAYPFVWLAIKIEDGGPALIAQSRVGLGNKIIKIYKFRSMKSSDGGKWVTAADDRITRVGSFIRKSRIDELPQLWNVLVGDISLVGPRPDIADLGLKLAGDIPYYKMRCLVAPGLSGWAQIHQDLPPQSVEETRERLAYDFYYIKNRSFLLDLKIAAKTIKTLLSRTGL